MQIEPVRHDLAQRTLGIVFIVGLLALCLWILRPFLPAIAWGATLVIATWPLLLSLQARLGNSRALPSTSVREQTRQI